MGGHKCPAGYHIMGDEMDKERYWYQKNDRIYKISNFQKTLDPTGVNTVKGAIGFYEQESIKDAREVAEEHNVHARSESFRVEHVGQSKTENIIADADVKMEKAKA